ncbi:MAG: hypothetical protein N2Z40_00860 [Caldimicrobium sp.]|nr:hypothetical protein [Caldimicrobium sp.]
MFCFSLTPSPIKDLKKLQRLEAIKDASQRKEVAFKLRAIEFHNSFGTEATVEASLVSVKLPSSRSERDFWIKFKAVAPFEIRGVKTELEREGMGMERGLTGRWKRSLLSIESL